MTISSGMIAFLFMATLAGIGTYRMLFMRSRHLQVVAGILVLLMWLVAVRILFYV